MFQALEWLQANYWDEQEQVLLETQTILKNKLVEHAGVVLNIFSTQQLLASEEGKGTSILPTTRSKGQDRKQKILALKRSRKGEISRDMFLYLMNIKLPRSREI